MLDLYSISETWRNLLILAGLAAFIGQAFLLALFMYRFRQDGRLYCEKALELLLLFVCGAMTYQLAVVGFNASAGLVFLPLLPVGRYLLCLLCCLLSGMVFFKAGQWPVLLAPLALFLTLPFWDGFDFFAQLYTASLLLLLVRGTGLAIYWQRVLRRSLSDLSVLQALDNLPSGILFYAADGHILLQNKAMQELMVKLLGQKVRDGREIYAAVMQGRVSGGTCKHVLAESVVYELNDKSVWRFKHDLILSGRKKYHQLAAADISEEWRLTDELAEQGVRLAGQKKELERMLADLSRLSFQKEFSRRKSRVHDVVGQRIALVQKALRSQKPDLAAVGSSLASLAADLEQDYEPVATRLEQIITSFAGVGVEIFVKGSPAQGETGAVQLELVREGVTNAVRHGLASKIWISFSVLDNSHVLSIRDNGTAPDFVKEGGGIRAMREKIRRFNGKLHIRTRPDFTLNVSLETPTEGASR